MALKYWRSSTERSMGELLLRVQHLNDAKFLKVVCLDSDMAGSNVEDFIHQIGFSASHPSGLLEVTGPLLQRLATAMTGYDEVWFYPAVHHGTNEPIVPLQSISADWDLSEERAPAAVVQSAQSVGGSLILSDCGLRNLIYLGNRPPNLADDSQWSAGEESMTD